MSSTREPPARLSPSRRTGLGWPAFPTPFDPDNRKIVVCGDWHGALGWAKQVFETAARVGAGTVVVAGDHAVLWPGERTAARKLNKIAERCGVRGVLVPGNHDWHDRLDAIAVGPDGFARMETWLWHAPRPTRWQIAGTRFAALGGGFSVDWRRRVPGKSWWPNEIITQEHVDALGADPVDVLITHEPPTHSHVRSDMRLDLVAEVASRDQRDLIALAAERTRPKVILHGHWHQRATGELRYSDGTTALVESLDQQYTPGNMLLLEVPDPQVPGADLVLRPLAPPAY